MNLTILLNLIYAAAQIFLLWKIWRVLIPVSELEARRKELNDSIKKFATMFAEAAEPPRPRKFTKKELDDTAADML